jgi:hypothetical protein
MGVECQCHALAALPPGKIGTHWIAGWVGQRLVWTGADNLSPRKFDPRTVQRVASRHNDCAIPAHTSPHNKKEMCVLASVYFMMLCRLRSYTANRCGRRSMTVDLVIAWMWSLTFITYYLRICLDIRNLLKYP